MCTATSCWRPYWKSHFIDDLDDDTIDLIVQGAARRPDPNSAIFIRTLGGAIDRVGADETAFAHRGARFNVSIDAIWSDPALDAASISWARELWSTLEPVSRGVYMNFAGLGEGEDAVRGMILGTHEERVDIIRRACDPDGLFEEAAARP